MKKILKRVAMLIDAHAWEALIAAVLTFGVFLMLYGASLTALLCLGFAHPYKEAVGVVILFATWAALYRLIRPDSK